MTVPGIFINGFEIRSLKRPLLTTEDFDAWKDELCLPELPEMVHGYSYVSISHADSGLNIVFNARDALSLVDNKKSTVTVGYAKTWLASKIAAGEADKLIPSESQFDWTYTTGYAGTSNGDSLESEIGVDLEQLHKPEEILFFDENILFEDELADNGGSLLVVKLRVMPSCLYVLQRQYMRVDDVMFRMLDTRLYHQFGQNTLIRETHLREATYKEMGYMIPQEKSKLIDANFMAQIIPLRATKLEAFDLTASYENGTPIIGRVVGFDQLPLPSRAKDSEPVKP